MRTDEQLMVAYATGDRDAFRELFERYAPLLTRVIARGISRRDVVRDLVQETFLQLHRARADYDEARPLRPWITTIAMNVRRDYLRRIMRRPEGSLQSDPDLERIADAGDQIAAAESTFLRAALAQLPDNQREVLELHWFEGMSFPEVAKVLGAKPSAVKVRAHRAYKRLRILLSDRNSVTAGAGSTNHPETAK